MSATVLHNRHHPQNGAWRKPSTRARARTNEQALKADDLRTGNAVKASGNVEKSSRRSVQIGFTGRYLDTETGLWYFRARYYSGSLGRFVGRDLRGTLPRALKGYGDGMSLYAGYFSPNFLDPSGMNKCKLKSFSVPDNLRTKVTGFSVNNALFVEQLANGPTQELTALAARMNPGLQLAEPGKEYSEGDYLGAFIGKYFEINAEFDNSDEPPCDCKCCSYRQEIDTTGNGTFIEDSSDSQFGGAGEGQRYGHREDQNRDNNKYLGCKYFGYDEPGLYLKPGQTGEYKVTFLGKIIDTCNNNKTVEQKTWTIHFKATAGNGPNEKNSIENFK